MAQWVAHLTRYVEVVGLSPIKGGPIKALNSEGVSCSSFVHEAKKLNRKHTVALNMTVT